MSEKIESILNNWAPHIFLGTLLVGFFGAEFLIFYNPEARADWTRMLPCAVFSPYMFAVALLGAVIGLVSLVYVPIFLVKYIRGKECENLLETCILAGVGLISGGGTVFRWIKYIVIDAYPAFGYNPDNVYAVVGLNTFAFLIVASIVGLIVGFIVFGILYLLANVIKLIIK